MKNFQIIVFLTFIGFLFSCKNTNSSESTQQTESISTAETNEVKENSVKEKKETTLYAWVDKLRIREKPTTKSEIVDEVKEGTSFVYLNEKTDYKERINLRGTLYNEPWLKIKTADGKEGWVYGGAVKFYEPVVDANPSAYDACFELLKNGKNERAYNCMEKARAKQLKKARTKVELVEDGINLTLLSGKKVELKNENEGEGKFNYEYWDYLPSMGFYLVKRTFEEYSNYFELVNDKSGKLTPIKGFPKASPNSKYLVTCNATNKEGTAFEYNGIIIYGFPDGRFKRIFGKSWEGTNNDPGVGPHHPIWIDDKTIELTLVPFGNDKTKLKNIKIVMDENGDWGIRE